MTQKAQLEEVADLMLEIYRTLVRMRYLDASWIHEGPHNIDGLLPLYRSLGLDDSIIYLYGILPYVDGAGGESIDFFQGSEFADFRRRKVVERGRDPFYEAQNFLPPYMTPLSLLGNYGSLIIYNARQHCVAIIDQESMGSGDHNIDEDCVVMKHGAQWPDEEEMRDAEDQDVGDGGDDEEDGATDDEDDEDSDDDPGSWNELDSRPAGHVLRDIFRWYQKLIETPGVGDQTIFEWDADLVRPLYRKHGWPDAYFDEDAFEVDRKRAYAVWLAQSDMKEAEDEMTRAKVPRGFDGLERDESWTMREARGRVEVADTIEELWVARWHLRWAEKMFEVRPDNVRRTEERRDRLKEEPLLLKEVLILR